MWIKEIKLNNFRNYKKETIELNDGINVFYGENAQGKTNIIEAIYLCALGKSFRTSRDSEMIKLNDLSTEEQNNMVNAYTNSATVSIDFQRVDRDGNIKITISNKKQAFVNGVKAKKLSELLSNLNIVIFTPDDIRILKGGPENRRKFLNVLIGQLKPNYIFLLNNYSKILEQRNKYLKQIKEEGKPEEMLEIWDEKLVEYGTQICKYRTEFIEKIKNKLGKVHEEITDNKEKIEIKYISECHDKEIYKKILKNRRKLDIIRGYTSKGIHRDDFRMNIDGKSIEAYGSQGQHRTAVLSLKLSELAVVSDEIGEAPVLLLDDFMSELDQQRVHNFLKKIEGVQVIITCTEKIKLEKNKILIYNVNDGKINWKEWKHRWKNTSMSMVQIKYKY